MQFAPLYPVLYRILKPAFRDCLWSGSEKEKAIALTFDDGPHPQYTPQLLKVLNRFEITASFFLLGTCVERSPRVVRAIYQSGHWIGLHGYKHDSFPRLSAPDLKSGLEKTQAAIYGACGLEPQFVRDVRPPNGFFTPRTLKLLHQWEYRPVMWSVVPEDWVNPGIARIVERVLKGVANGSIVVLHDGFYGGQNVADATALIIPLLLAEGYKFITVEQLRTVR